MSEYNFNRGTLPDGRYAIDHPDRVDADGNQIRIAKEIEAAFPGMVFTTHAIGNTFTLRASWSLTEEQLVVLGQILDTHRANG